MAARRVFLVAVLMLAAVAHSSAYRTRSSKDAVLLEDVKTLTLRHGQSAAARRGSPIPQMNCVGGDACSAEQPQVMQCRNMGSDGVDFQWRCEADLSTDVRLGSTTVSCEGYDSPDDDRVLRGSCGVEYELWYTREGRANRNRGGRDSYSTRTNGGAYDSYSTGGGGYEYSDYGYRSRRSQGWGMGSYMMLGIMGLLAFYLIKSCFQGGATPAQAGGQGGGGGGGGYGGGGGHGGGGGGGGHGGGGPGYGDANCAPGVSTAYGAGTGGWGMGRGPGGGGFWTGAGLGGLLGYMMGNRRGYGGYGGYGAYGARPGWGAGWGGGGMRMGGGGMGMGGMRMGGGGGMRMGGGTRTASGFGGTRRR